MRKLIGTLGLGLLLAGIWATSAQALVLYDQTDSPAAGFVDSTSFGPTDVNTSEAADDFVVPPNNTWQITEADVFGRFAIVGRSDPEGSISTLAASPVDVHIYADDGAGAPGALLYTALGINGDNSPNFTIPLGGVPPLSAGHYWLEVQGSDGVTNGLWEWQMRTVVANDPARVQFPNNDFCQTWRTINNCYEAGPLDLRFRLLGPDPNIGKPSTCLNLSAQAANFHPRKPKKPFQLGVRTKFTVPVPSGVDLDASITTRSGQTESLGKHAFGDLGVRKLRFALPAALKGVLQHGDKVALNMHATVTPNDKCAGPYTQDLTVNTRVVNVQTSLLLP